jgi:integrase
MKEFSSHAQKSNISPHKVGGDNSIMSKWGKIRKNKQRGTWYVDITWEGKRHHIYQMPINGGFITCTSEANAIELRSIINSEIERGIFNPARYKSAKPMHLSAYADRWLERIQSSISSVTMHDYKNSLKNHILPFLGNEYLPDISSDKLKDFCNQISRGDKGKKNVLGCLHKLMSDAYDAGHITRIPKFPTVKIGKKAVIWIDKEDQQIILEKIQPEDRYIFEFMRLTGCRPSEARAFRKIDIRKNHILFRVTFDRYEKEVEIKTKIERTYPMIEPLKEVLDKAPDRDLRYRFTYSVTGKPYTRSTINRIWNKACDSAGVPRIKLYNGTKHSLGCQMINAGVDKDVVRQLFGHTSREMTDAYAEASPVTLRNALNKVVGIKK